MRYKFHTASGARYLIDTDKMTWKRGAEATLPGHEDIPGLAVNKGPLVSLPDLYIGEPAIIDYGPGMLEFIRTTPVILIELLD